MSKLSELKIKRADEMYKIETLSNRSDLSPTDERDFNISTARVEDLQEQIETLERSEKTNMKTATLLSKRDEELSEESLREYFDNSLAGVNQKPLKIEFRSEPIYTTSNSNILNKTVVPFDNLYSNSEELLKSLGIKFLTNLSSTLVLPVFNETVARYANEGQDASSADLTPLTVEMEAHRCTTYQTLSRELLAQTNPDLYSSVVQNLKQACWNAVATKFFENFLEDNATQISNFSGGPVGLKDLTQMEASLGSFTSLNPKYVSSLNAKAYLKSTADPRGIHLLWEDDILNGKTAFATGALKQDSIILADFTKSIVGIWGNGIEVILDPFTQAAKGLIILTAIMLTDSATQNKSAAVIMADASTY